MRGSYGYCCCWLRFRWRSAQESRHFTFHYGFTVRDVPAGERVRVWIPVAHSDEFQEVKVISANGDLKLKKTHESRFGNEMYYAETSKATRPTCTSKLSTTWCVTSD